MHSYTLIGYPLGHSMSPWIHERLFKMAGREGAYTLTELPPEAFADTVAELRALNGFNITIPYKTDIIPYLDELDETAARYRSVNCVQNTNGKAIGYNTDCTGFLRSVENFDLGGRVLLIGCGGVGRMMAMEAVLAGADLTLTEKDLPKAEALAAELRAAVPGASLRILEDAPEEHFDLLMNATPVGMYPKTDRCPVTDTLIAQCDAVFDVIYNPTETLLVQKARALGKPAVGGAAMLVWQAVRAHEIWDGDSYAPADIAALIAAMEEKVNRSFPTKGES